MPAPEPSERHVLDRWALSEAHRLVRSVTESLENFDTQRAGSAIAAYVDDLSNWYVRRSRRRFWSADPGALATLHECLRLVTLVSAPLTPFITERVWRDLFASTTEDSPSVHLASWPQVDEGLVDADLDRRVQLARRIVELGRAARADAKVRTRQPLRRALVPSAAWRTLGEDLRAEVAEELNVGSVEALDSAGDLVDHSAKGNFRALGKRFARRTPDVAAAIAAADAEALATSLRETGAASVTVGDDSVEVTADEVILSERPREGWSVANEHGETVALDLELTPQLRRAGLAREVVRLVQEARKASGFEVSDRITLTWQGDGELAEALTEHEKLIADEVLAVEITRGEPDPDAARVDEDLSLRFAVAKVVAQ